MISGTVSVYALLWRLKSNNDNFITVCQQIAVDIHDVTKDSNRFLSSMVSKNYNI